MSDDNLKLGKVGVLGRFKPLHLGAARLLEEVCRQSEQVVIGIGSSNKYNIRNPFTFEETKEMIMRYLSPSYSNYTIIPIDDFAHIPQFSDGERWTQEILEKYGALDAFVSGNEYVKKLLQPHYRLIESFALVPPEKWIKVSGTIVRVALAKGEGWEKLVPESIAAYMKEKGLDARFRREFGLQTLAELANGNVYDRNVEAEKEHTLMK